LTTRAAVESKGQDGRGLVVRMRKLAHKAWQICAAKFPQKIKAQGEFETCLNIRNHSFCSFIKPTMGTPQLLLQSEEISTLPVHSQKFKISSSQPIYRIRNLFNGRKRYLITFKSYVFHQHEERRGTLQVIKDTS
jgi:hypothetical protein